jgi:hypothetical protein
LLTTVGIITCDIESSLVRLVALRLILGFNTARNKKLKGVTYAITGIHAPRQPVYRSRIG